ncbi:unnamed protein product [Rhizopus stolonifer]
MQESIFKKLLAVASPGYIRRRKILIPKHFQNQLDNGTRHCEQGMGTIVEEDPLCRRRPAEKQLQYVNMKHIKAFKVDIRFLYDLNGNEYDVGAGEAAKEAIDEAKVLNDKSKLLREGKKMF